MRIGIIGLKPVDIKGQEEKIKEWIAAELDQSQKSSLAGPPHDCFCAGGKGTDQIFGQCVLGKGHNLHIIFPYERKESAAVKALATAAMSVSYTEKKKKKGCYALQNKNMVDNIDLLLVVWKGRMTGAIGRTINFAQAAGIPIHYLNLEEDSDVWEEERTGEVDS